MSNRAFEAFRPHANSIRVRAATTANITISTALNSGDTLDGVTLADEMLVLVKDQSTAAENGIYVAGTVPRRYVDFSADIRGTTGAYDMHPGLLVVVEQGTTNADTVWLCTSNRGGTLGTTALTFQHRTSREKLLAARDYYVRTDGSDSNTGLANTSGSAFLTIQKAVNVVLNTIDLNGFAVTINVADGTYTDGVTISRAPVGSGTFSIIGNTTTPANVVISTTSASCFAVSSGAVVTIRGFKLQTTTSGDCINAFSSAYVLVGTVNFGSCAGHHFNVGGEATVLLTHDYTISGGAVGHFHTGNPSLISAGSITVTLSGTPAFSSYFSGTAGGYQQLGSITFSGSATGQRFFAHKNGVIDVNASGLTFLPGNAAGQVFTGGQYVGPSPGDLGQQVAKFWAYVTVSGGTPTLQVSYNVTSITDAGVGLLTVTIATDFSSAQWACFVATRDTATMAEPNTLAAGSVVCANRNLTPALQDPAAWHVVGFGDQV